MNVEHQQAVAAEVFAVLNSGKLELPTLPEIAIKIREAIDDPNISAEVLVRLLSTDPSISAQIIKTANSAAYSNGSQVNDLRSAISRLGYRMLRNMVMIITMSKLFKASNPIIGQELKRLWDHSREVAANSYVLALHQKHLKPDQAMLAGLMHDLGALPLCIYADRYHPRLDRETLDGLIRRFSTEVGTKLLEKWLFPPDMVEVVAQHENLQRMTADGLSDYIDVVTVANLMLPTTAKFVAWENVSATGRLGYSPSQCQNFLSSHAEQILAVRQMLGFSDSPPVAIKSAPQQTIPAKNSSSTIPDENLNRTPSFLSGLFKFFK